jgi:tRNA-dihydrouridine synthase
MDGNPTLILAPLRGFTDYIFRNAFCRHFDGFDSALAPFISAVSAARCKPAQLEDLLPENNRHLPVVPQIMTNQAPAFLSLARLLADFGYDIVNWNLGCPYPMVAKKKRGCGLLPYPELIDAFLDHVCADMPGRISIKMRLGRFHAEEIDRLVPVLNRYPLTEVIIHPRTGKQMYTGELDLEAFEACMAEIRHRIVFNGDLRSLERFTAAAGRFGAGVAGWMIGRGALIDPFLPSAIKRGRQDADRRLERFKGFYDDLFDSYRQKLHGPGHLLDRMKGFWKYFSQAFENGRQIEKQVHRTHRLDHYLRIVKRFFEEDARWVG